MTSLFWHRPCLESRLSKIFRFSSSHFSDQFFPLSPFSPFHFSKAWATYNKFLNAYYGHQISLSTLKRRFRALDFHRKPLIPWRETVGEVNNAVQKEFDPSGANLGYCRIWASLKKRKILVKKKTFEKQSLNQKAEEVQQRKRGKLFRRKYRNPGPNYTWNIDGHDKLKSFGFSVHGCIDWFLRKLIWFEVTSSKKFPEIISKDHHHLKGVPKKKKRKQMMVLSTHCLNLYTYIYAAFMII